MIIAARIVSLTGVDFDAENCVVTVSGDIVSGDIVSGDPFDFDVQTLTRMTATKAKLTRFFDVVADPKYLMASRFHFLISTLRRDHMTL